MQSEKKFVNNDIYFIEVVQDKIIMNDNYDGINILNNELKIIKNLHLFDDIVIDSSYVKDNEIILYCYENSCFVYLNVDTYVYKVIPLSAEFSDLSFLSLYEWKDNELILLADAGSVLVRINMLSYIVQKEYVEKKTFPIKSAWEKLSKFIVHKVYPDRKIAIVEMNNVLKIINYMDDTGLILNIKNIDFYDIEVMENFAALINEFEVFVWHGNQNVKLVPLPKGYRFLRCKFTCAYERKYLLLLLCNNADSSICKLQKYSMETDLFS